MASFSPKIGLALGSGGARGLAHIGVLQEFEKNNIPIHMIAGSSIGALIGAYYASHKDSRRLEEFALSFNRRKGFSLFAPSIKGGLLKGEKIEQLLGEMLHGLSFHNLLLPFAAVATDFTTAEPVVFREGNIIKAIRASISIPAIFQPVKHEKRQLADGGLSNPVPVEIVRSMGADIVIAVNLDNIYTNQKAAQVLPLMKIPFHSMNILRHHLALHSAKTADIDIAPSVSEVGIIGWSYFFNTEKAQAVIKEGRSAASEAMSEIHQALLSNKQGKARVSITELLRRVLRR